MSQREFWISVGSTYSYLTVMRLADAEEKHGIRFDWRPFSVREIMVEMDNIPFATKPIKARYMWRDIERRAAMYGFHPKLPAPYPLKEFDLANRVAVLAASEGWCRDYITGTYRRWFDDGLPAGQPQNLSATLTDLGQNPEEVTERALSDEIGAGYRTATDEARQRGVFGAPSFVVDGELFWGDDRLDDAMAWAKHGSLARSG